VKSTHLHVMPRLKMRGALLPLSHRPTSSRRGNFVNKETTLSVTAVNTMNRNK